MKNLTIRKIDDMHVHLRQGDMLRNVLPPTVMQCGKALVMPNTNPPIATPEDVIAYRQTILAALAPQTMFTPLMTFKILPSTTIEQVRAMQNSGAVAGKLYPEGVTTNSEDGVRDLTTLYEIYRAMEECGLVLCIHGEVPGVFSLDREKAFLGTLEKLAGDFPRLRIVLEHATTADAIKTVSSLPANVAATLTVHHLYITLDDVIGDRLQPHLFCKPIAKRESDRQALRDAVISGNKKFFLGTDSAPHAVEAKECACGAAGVYSAPVIVPALIQLFEDLGCLDRFEPFVSEFGSRFYGLSLNEERLTVANQSWLVPKIYNGVVPFMADQELRWKVVENDDAGKADASAKALSAS
jgi:dihydroorotase